MTDIYDVDLVELRLYLNSALYHLEGIEPQEQLALIKRDITALCGSLAKVCRFGGPDARDTTLEPRRTDSDKITNVHRLAA